MTFYYWHALHPKIQWIAMDYSGAWYGYQDKPTRDRDHWGHPDLDWDCLEAFNPSIFPDLPWEDSLIMRPKT